MAKQRPSVHKRQRELKKAEKAAQKRERKLNRDQQDSEVPPEDADVAPGADSGNTGRSSNESQPDLIRHRTSVGDYLDFFSRKPGAAARVKSTTSSPVSVLMSWCRLTTFTPVTSRTIDSRTGRAVSINWVLTCLRSSLGSCRRCGSEL